jgi:hypothetical protein
MGRTRSRETDMSDDSRLTAPRDLERFLAEAARHPPVRTTDRGRLMFALDATASRQPTWDLACDLQVQLFEATRDIGGLDLELCFFRGFREFRSSGWLRDPAPLRERMGRVRCVAGRTQIARVLRHASKETRQARIQAVVYVGDAMEEDADTLCGLAGDLGLLGTPLFMFHEGRDGQARETFREMARASGGAFAQFEPGAAARLAALLRGVAVFAAGGRAALEALARNDGAAAGLLQDLRSER